MWFKRAVFMRINDELKNTSFSGAGVFTETIISTFIYCYNEYLSCCTVIYRIIFHLHPITANFKNTSSTCLGGVIST